jgi:hypothetical protein
MTSALDTSGEQLADAFMAALAREGAVFEVASLRMKKPLMDRVEHYPDRAPRHDQMAAFMRQWVGNFPQNWRTRTVRPAGARHDGGMQWTRSHA